MGCRLVLQIKSEGWENPNTLKDSYDFLLLRIYPSPFLWVENGDYNHKVGEGMEMCSKRHDDASGRRQEGKRLVLHLHAHLQQRLFKSC